MSWELRDAKLIAVNLMSLGGVALARRRFVHAALLLAAGQQLLDSLPHFLAPGYRAEFDALIGETRAALNEESFAQAWAKGRALSQEAAVATALSEAAPDESATDTDPVESRAAVA